MKDLLLEFLNKVLNEAPAERKFKAVRVMAGGERVVAFSSEENMDAAIQKGTHRPYDPETDSHLEEPTKKTSPTKQPRTRQTKTPVTPRQKTSPSKERERMDSKAERAVSTLTDDPAFAYLPERSRRFRAAQFLRLKAITADSSLSREQLKARDELEQGIKELLRLYSSGTKRNLASAQRLARDLHAKFKFFSNSSGKSFKTVVFGQRHRHVVGQGASGKTTNLASDLVEIFEKLGIDLRKEKDGDKQLKQGASNASKPNLGEVSYGYARKGKGRPAPTIPADPVVEKVFGALSYLPEKFRSLYGPKDPNTGHLLEQTPETRRTYFEHSITSNDSIRNTSALLRENGIPNMADALDAHESRMKKISENWDKMTPEQRKKAVQDSYATMAIELARADKELCGSILKNLAEINLYQQELANDEEVYLPAAGTFPAADKLVRTGAGTKGERISGISVKYGKSGIVFGMPAQTNTLMMWHPDESYHDISTVRPGEPGYEAGIRSDSFEKTNWSRLMDDSGYSSVLTKKDNEELRTSFQQFEDCVKQRRKKLGDISNRNIIESWKHCSDPKQPHMKSIIGVLSRNMGKLESLIGKENTSLLEKNPEAFPTLMAFHSGLRTSDGLGNLRHNHQTISQEGRGGSVEYVDETEDGSADYRYWHCQFRATDDRGGGLIAGFSRESKE